MRYSLRTLLLLLTVAGCSCAVYYKVYVAPNLPFAVAKLENGLEIKLWAKPNFYSSVDIDEAGESVTSGPEPGQQSMFAEIRSEDGKLVFPLCEMDVNLEGQTDFVSVAYSDNREFAAIYAPNNRDILILADFRYQKFASPMTIWSADYDAIRNGPLRPRSDLSPGPVRMQWQNVLDEIRTANPNVSIDWNCL